MLEHVHLVPGRLRVKTPLFRRNGHMAADAQAKLGQIPGVSRIEVNTATGSLIIHYDDRKLGSTALWEELVELGYVPDGHRIPRSSQPAAASMGTSLTEALSRTLVNTIAERSAAALVRAIL